MAADIALAGFKTLPLFAALDETASGVRDFAKSDLHLDPAARSADRLSMAALVDAWQAARVRTSRRNEREAEASLLQQPQVLMKSEVTQLRGLFRQRHHELGDDLSPAASLIEMVCEHVQQHDIKAISM
eukprot:2927942-Amphidinium_carterae.1